MKKIILFILIISNLAIAEDCVWKWVNPLPQGNNLNYIKFASKKVVYISGSYGTIMKSTDGGINWQVQNSGTTNNLYDISIIDENNVFILAQNNLLLQTTDGGKNWIQKYIPRKYSGTMKFFDYLNGYITFLPDKILLKTSDGGETWDSTKIGNDDKLSSICYINQNEAIITQTDTSKKEYLMITSDAGKTWSRIENILEADYQKMYFINNQTGLLSSSIGLFKTSDGGETWVLINDAVYDISYFKFFDENNGYIWGKYFIYSTTDGGAKWKAEYSGSFDKEINSIDIFENGFVIGVGNYGVIKRTTDNGYTWENQHKGIGINENLNKIQFINENTGWLISEDGLIFKTINAGKSWFELTKFFKNKSIYYYNFFDENTGIFSVIQNAGYNYNTILYKTTNGGADWFELYEFNNSMVFCFHNENIFWAHYFTYDNEKKDYDSYLYKTTDGGINWDYPKYFKDIYISSLEFTDENFSSFITNKTKYKGLYVTTNGGDDWKTIKLDSNLTITNYSFIDENNILVGSKGGILKTTDGGESWDNIQLDSNETYSVKSFINDSTCWALAGIGLPLTFKSHYKTTNQGESWEKKFDSTNFNGIKFFDELNGYVYSTKLGSIFKTTDGGDSWVNFNTGTNQSLSFYFTGKDNGWAIGDSGILLHYSCTETAVEDALPFSESTDFQIFPNPATNQITLSIPEEQNINSISIFNSLGMEVKRIEPTEIIGKSKITISTANLPGGLYHCSIINQAGRVTKSFVVLR